MAAKTRFPFLCAVLIVSSWIGLSAVSAQSSICELLETRYSMQVGDWIWINPETVVFEVFGSEWDATGFNLVSVEVWYRYDFANSLLTEVDDPPVRVLRGIARSPDELLTLIDASPSGNALVYPRYDAVNDQYDYWYTDVPTGAQVDLTVSMPAVISAEAVWAAQASRFVLQSNIYNSELFPTVYVSIESHTPEVTTLQDVPEFSQVVFPYIGFNVMGLSADGRYLVIDPEQPPYLTKIFDWQGREWIDLPFRPLGHRGGVVWTALHEFIVLTDAGVIRYNIDTAAIEVIASPSQLNTVLYSGSFSPTGNYIIGLWPTTENGVTTSHIAVCRLNLSP